MKFKLFLIVLAGSVFLNVNNLKAQTDAKPSEASLQAAARVVEVSGLKENMTKMFGQIIAMQAGRLPENQRAAFTVAMNKFLDKYVSWDQLRSAFIPIYASSYTEDELNKIADFLASPAGKAMTSKQPELMQKGAAWGVKVVQDHQAELEQMMKEAMYGPEIKDPGKQ